MKLKGIVLVVILLLVSIMMPFSVYAETVLGDSPIIGVNIKYRDYDIDHEPYQLSASLEMPYRWQCVSSHSTMGCQVWSSQDTSGTIQDEITGYINVSNGSYTDILYEYEFILDKSYVGYIDFSSAIGVTAYNRYYVNGKSFTLTSKQLITSFTVSRYNLEYAPENVIDMCRMWNIPIESWNINVFDFNEGFEIVPFEDANSGLINYLDYPMFSIPANRNIYSFYSSLTGPRSSYHFVMLINKNSYDVPSFQRFVSVTNGEIINFSYLTQFRDNANANWYSLVVFDVSNFTSSELISLQSVQDIKIIGIYANTSNFTNVSTDFAIRFGISNSMLDNINKIANGTTQSNSAASGLDQSNDQMASDMNDLATIESGYNQQFNNQLQSIDFTSPLQNNAGILPAANFVITIFNGLINNNPFSVLIIIVCILLIGKKVIGK